MWRSRGRCVIKPAYSVSFLLSINIFVMAKRSLLSRCPSYVCVPLSVGHWPVYSNWMYLQSAVDNHCILKIETIWISKTSAIRPISKWCLTSKPFRKRADMAILLFYFPLTTDQWTCVSAGPLGSYCALKEAEIRITSAFSMWCHNPPSLPPQKEPTLPLKHCDNLK